MKEGTGAGVLDKGAVGLWTELVSQHSLVGAAVGLG